MIHKMLLEAETAADSKKLQLVESTYCCFEDICDCASVGLLMQKRSTAAAPLPAPGAALCQQGRLSQHCPGTRRLPAPSLRWPRDAAGAVDMAGAAQKLYCTKV